MQLPQNGTKNITFCFFKTFGSALALPHVRNEGVGAGARDGDLSISLLCLLSRLCRPSLSACQEKGGGGRGETPFQLSDSAIALSHFRN